VPVYLLKPPIRYPIEPQSDVTGDMDRLRAERSWLLDGLRDRKDSGLPTVVGPSHPANKRWAAWEEEAGALLVRLSCLAALPASLSQDYFFGEDPLLAETDTFLRGARAAVKDLINLADTTARKAGPELGRLNLVRLTAQGRGQGDDLIRAMVDQARSAALARFVIERPRVGVPEGAFLGLHSPTVSCQTVHLR